MVTGELIPFARPTTLEQAFHLLSSQPWSVLAGSTDVFPAHVDRPIEQPVLDISALSSLKRITLEDQFWRLGALVTWSDVVNADLPPAFDGLKLAAREIGSVQIQNAGTIGGNVCNASPAADSVPPLLTLDAKVELSSSTGQRLLPLSDFITGYRATARRDDELVTAVIIPEASTTGVGIFKKLGARKYLVISIVMAAVRLHVLEDKVTEVRIALGACSPVATRLFDLERALIGQRPATLSGIVGGHHLASLSPIDDIRATAGYRRDAALELVRRMVSAAAGAEG